MSKSGVGEQAVRAQVLLRPDQWEEVRRFVAEDQRWSSASHFVRLAIDAALVRAREGR